MKCATKMVELLSLHIGRFQRERAEYERTLPPALLVFTPVPAGSQESGAEDEHHFRTLTSVATPMLGVGEPIVFPVVKNQENAFGRGITVGRTGNNDVVLDDGTVSRFHAWFQREPDGSYTVTDAGSKNGSFVTGVRLQPRAPLAAGGRHAGALWPRGPDLLSGERLHQGARPQDDAVSASGPSQDLINMGFTLFSSGNRERSRWPLTTEAFGLTDVGRKRQHNEDAMLVDAVARPLHRRRRHGRPRGRRGRQRAGHRGRQAAHRSRTGTILKDLGAEPQSQANRAAAAALVEVAVQRACADIYRMAAADATKRGMGTTFVCLAVGGNKGVIGHVGDSRVYLVRNGQCHRLTEDHTLVAAQLKAGTITKEQAATSQYRNVITRAVGIQESVQVDTLIVDLLPGDIFLLCSDGLHGYLDGRRDRAARRSGAARETCRERFIDARQRARRQGQHHRGGGAASRATARSAAEESAEAQSRMEALRKIPLFRHLTYKEQTAVLSIATTRTFPGGREIVTEGQPGEELFVVIRGRVAIEKNGVEIAELRAGGHFGEMGLIDNAPRSATVRATEPTRVMVIARSDLMNLMKRESILAVKMLWSFVQVLSDRLRATNSELCEARQELAVAQAIQPFAEE